MKKIFLLGLFSYFGLAAQAQTEADIQKMDYRTIDSISNHLYGEGSYQKGLIYAKTLVKKYEEAAAPVDTNYLNSVSFLASYHKRLGLYRDALVYNKKAAELAGKHLPDTEPALYTYLNNLSTAYGYLGMKEEANAVSQDALERCERSLGKNSGGYMQLLSNMANRKMQSGDIAVAETMYQEVIALAQANGGPDNPQQLTAWGNLGMIALRKKQYEQAENCIKESVRLAEMHWGPFSNRYIGAMSRLAGLYTQTNRLQEAEAIFKKLMQSALKGGGKSDLYATMANNTANFYLQTNRFDLAEQYARESLQIGREGQFVLDVIDASNTLAQALLKQNRAAEALPFLQEALLANSPVRDSMGVDALLDRLATLDFSDVRNPTLRIYTQRILATALAELAQQGDAANWQALQLKNTEVALRFLEQRQRAQQAEEDKFNSLEMQAGFVQRGIELALALGRDSTAFSLSEQNKTALLADALQTRQARSLSDLPDSLSEREAQLQRDLVDIKKRLLETKQPEKQQKLQADLNDINQSIAVFNEMLRQQFPKYYALKNAPSTTGLRDIQNLLADDAVLIAYSVFDTTTHLFEIGKTQWKHHRIAIGRDSLERRVAALRKSLSNYGFIEKSAEEAYALYTNEAHWFYTQWLEPAIGQLQGVQQLIIVPDHQLGHIPFEALLTEAAQGRDYKNLPYLIKKYKISYNYSATLWKENREAVARPSNGKMIAFAAEYGNSESVPEWRDAVTRSLRGHLTELPEVKKEVENLQQLFAGDFAIGASANEQYFKQQSGNYSVIHLAMHGLLNSKNPILSSLAFTENKDTSEDNFLHAYEIAHQQLSASLVVLSACETGFGKFQQGEGVMSLGRAFMYAGVPALLVSLWEVNDASTSRLMELFYTNLAAGKDKAAALQAAKLDYLEKADSTAAHPAFWSPFVLLGDERPIELKQRGGWLWWGIIGGALAAALVGMWAMRRRG